MDKDTKKNYQLYGRNDMIMLDEHNKIYGSLGLAEPYIVATKEGETLLLDGAKDDEPFIGLSLYGKSHQNTVAGNQLFDVSKGGVGWIDTETGEFVTSTDNYVSDFIKIEPLSQYYINGEAFNPGYIYTYDSNKTFIRRENSSRNISTPENAEYLRFAISAGAEMALERAKTVMLNAGSEELPWEPYTGGQPSPNPDYPQEIVSVGDNGNIGVDVYGGNLVDYYDAVPNDTGAIRYEGNRLYFMRDNHNVITAVQGGATWVLNLKKGTLYVNASESVPLRVYKGNVFETEYDSGNRIYTNGGLRNHTLEIPEDGVYTIGLWVDATNIELFVDYLNVNYIPNQTGISNYSPMQSLIVSTPNGLPGIPVSSGGNYTDENGQQWISDEIDFKRGKYVQRVAHYVFDGSEDEAWSITHYDTFDFDYAYIMVNRSIDKCETKLLCNMGVSRTWSAIGCCFVDNHKSFIFYHPFISNVLSQGVNAWKSWLQDNPLELYYTLETPIETDLTPEQITAYQSLHTNYPTTTVMNDEGAGMKAIYKQIENGG